MCFVVFLEIGFENFNKWKLEKRPLLGGLSVNASVTEARRSHENFLVHDYELRYLSGVKSYTTNYFNVFFSKLFQLICFNSLSTTNLWFGPVTSRSQHNRQYSNDNLEIVIKQLNRKKHFHGWSRYNYCSSVNAN